MTTIDTTQLVPAQRPGPVAAGLRTGARRARPVSRAVEAGAAWRRSYARVLLLGDAVVLVLCTVAALAVRPAETVVAVPVPVVVVLALGLWLPVLALGRCYEQRFLGHGNEEYTRLVNASLRLFFVVSTLCFALQLPLSRGYLAVLLPLGTAGLLLVRLAARAVVFHLRSAGRLLSRVLVAGDEEQVRELAARFQRTGEYDVVGVCLTGGRSTGLLALPVLGTLSTLPQTVRAADVDAVALASVPGLHGEGLRRLSVELEGTGVELLVAPALTEVAGPRVSVRPVCGMPLLHVDQPELTGARHVVKAVFDRVGALALLVVLAPLLLVVAALVRVTSAGPALFLQERVGRDGVRFRVWKFRSMYVDAEARRAALEHANEHDGVLFKMRQDPRVTPVGRVLRRYSLDELPQLVNVLLGQMSLVGPRPPLASEVDRYEGREHRRLLVKPGMTGLWQVSGRSDLSWAETVRLDLHYVENWSLALDLTVLARTVRTVVGGRGAY